MTDKTELRDKLGITKQGSGEKWTARQKKSDKTGRASIKRAEREREGERDSCGKSIRRAIAAEAREEMQNDKRHGGEGRKRRERELGKCSSSLA